jgi:DNA (cytosine-5)-methyltransferase 1
MENTNTLAPPDKLRVLDLFSGIGGFSLGLERTGGFETAAFCEIEPFPRKVLAKHWPGVKCYEDVTKLTGDILKRDGISVDVITGGFPCQDISCAGKQAGIGEGTRSGLWSEIVRLIGELSPRYVIVENVAALLSGPSEQRGGWFGRILGDLAECGYDAEWENIPASALGAPHRRERVWIVAYPNGFGELSADRSSPKRAAGNDTGGKLSGNCGPNNVADAKRLRQSRPGKQILAGHCAQDSKGQASDAFNERFRQVWGPEPDVGRGIDGLSAIMDGDLSDAAKKRAAEILRNMQLCDDPQEVWEAAGGLNGVSQPEILLSFLCEYEARKDSGRLAVEREEARQQCLRGVWQHIELARASLQSRHNGQHADEFANALRKLSWSSPSLYPQAWKSGLWEDGVKRVANGVPQRVDRLKGLGNAVVPQIPELIGRAILAAESAGAR